jgi:hypothetical protein
MACPMHVERGVADDFLQSIAIATSPWYTPNALLIMPWNRLGVLLLLTRPPRHDNEVKLHDLEFGIVCTSFSLICARRKTHSRNAQRPHVAEDPDGTRVTCMLSPRWSVGSCHHANSINLDDPEKAWQQLEAHAADCSECCVGIVMTEGPQELQFIDASDRSPGARWRNEQLARSHVAKLRQQKLARRQQTFATSLVPSSYSDSDAGLVNAYQEPSASSNLPRPLSPVFGALDAETWSPGLKREPAEVIASCTSIISRLSLAWADDKQT